MSRELQAAMEAVEKAGQAVLRMYEAEGTTASLKENSEPVTEADLVSQEIIEQELKGFSYPLLAEEKEEDLSRLEKERVWIVDPLDGTKDFLFRTGEFSVMIGLAVRGEPFLGVVYAPVLGALYAAEKGAGAFLELQGERHKLRVRGCNSLKEAVAFMSRSHLSPEEEELLEMMGVKEIRQKGSAGIKLCALASGQGDLYFNLSNKTSQWDLAAPECILREAGGVITDSAGEKFFYNRPGTRNLKGFIASSLALHPAALSAAAKLRP